MPIRWSALKVSEAMDMAEEFLNQVTEPLEQAKMVTKEARRISNLPQYVDDRLARLLDRIDRMEQVWGAIKSVRDSLPSEALKAEEKMSTYGSQQSLV